MQAGYNKTRREERTRRKDEQTGLVRRGLELARIIIMIIIITLQNPAVAPLEDEELKNGSSGLDANVPAGRTWGADGLAVVVVQGRP